jgi:hypothetical protein
MKKNSVSKILAILVQIAWIVVALVGGVFVLVVSRMKEVPLENTIFFTTHLAPGVFFMLFGIVLLVVGLGLGWWWYYEYFYSHTVFVKTPYGELTLHKKAIQGYLEEQLLALPEVVNCDVHVAIVKRRFISLDVRVVVNADGSCREYGENLQQEILQILLSTFGIKDIRRFHLQIQEFRGGNSQAIKYR